jgi:hypothetical protein
MWEDAKEESSGKGSLNWTHSTCKRNANADVLIIDAPHVSYLPN